MLAIVSAIQRKGVGYRGWVVGTPHTQPFLPHSHIVKRASVVCRRRRRRLSCRHRRCLSRCRRCRRMSRCCCRRLSRCRCHHLSHRPLSSSVVRPLSLLMGWCGLRTRPECTGCLHRVSRWCWRESAPEEEGDTHLEIQQWEHHPAILIPLAPRACEYCGPSSSSIVGCRCCCRLSLLVVIPTISEISRIESRRRPRTSAAVFEVAWPIGHCR